MVNVWAIRNSRKSPVGEYLRTSLEMEKMNIQEALHVKEEFHEKGSIVWEKVCCGKRGCKCQSGVLHGPFPYLHYWGEGKVKRRYLSKAVGQLVACPKTELMERLAEIEKDLSQEKMPEEM